MLDEDGDDDDDVRDDDGNGDSTIDFVSYSVRCNL